MQCRCGAVTADGIWLCASCAERFEYRLAEVDAVLTELAHAVPRLTLTATYGDRTPGVRALHAPAPVNVDAVSAGDALHRWLMGTALRLAQVTGNRLTGRTPDALASYLISGLPRLRSLSWTPELHPALDILLKDCERVTHEAAPRVFAGTCAECETDLYARKGDHEARCKTCGATYEVLKWRAHAQTAKDYYIGSAADISRKLAAPEYGYEVPPKIITQWASRLVVPQPDGTKKPRLERANEPTDENGLYVPPVYRLGDVLKLNLERYEKKPLEGRTA
jgi:hypothetical protein